MSSSSPSSGCAIAGAVGHADWNISALRRVLGDLNTDVQFIETIPKRGYRFVAPVSEVPKQTEVEITNVSPSEPPTLVRLSPRRRLPPKPSKTTAVLLVLLEWLV